MKSSGLFSDITKRSVENFGLLVCFFIYRLSRGVGPHGV
jgi:hypothetical protein